MAVDSVEFWGTARAWHRHTIIWYDPWEGHDHVDTGVAVAPGRTDLRTKFFYLENINGEAGHHVKIFYNRVRDVF